MKYAIKYLFAEIESVMRRNMGISKKGNEWNGRQLMDFLSSFDPNSFTIALILELESRDEF